MSKGASGKNKFEKQKMYGKEGAKGGHIKLIRGLKAIF